jgi:hypothetical protein
MPFYQDHFLNYLILHQVVFLNQYAKTKLFPNPLPHTLPPPTFHLRILFQLD